MKKCIYKIKINFAHRKDFVMIKPLSFFYNPNLYQEKPVAKRGIEKDWQVRREEWRNKMPSILGIIIAVILATNSFYMTSEQEAAVVTTLGIPHAVTSAGPHFKIPFVQKVEKVSTVVKAMEIGYIPTNNQNNTTESLMITSDYNFVNVDFYIEYRVTDPIKALYNSREPAIILRALAQSYIRDTVGKYEVDSVLTDGKALIQSEIQTKLTQRMEQEDIGLQVTNISIQDAEPPTDEVVAAFKSVESARQKQDTTINEANKYRSEQKPKAVAQADEIIRKAEATKEARINEAIGQTTRFNSMYAEYIKYPTITKQRMFYEAMEEILPDLKVVINDGSGGVSKFYPIESFTDSGNK